MNYKNERYRSDLVFKLEKNDYKKVTNLVKSENELSVFSVINGVNPGEIFVNSIDNPTSVLIRTSECNLIAGNSTDEVFNSHVSEELDFWDPLVPDSLEWMNKIPTIHKNHFIRKYKRRHYVLTADSFIDCTEPLKTGYILEKVNMSFLKECSLENSKLILDTLAENWGSEENFKKHGTGYLVRNEKTIISWALADCSFKTTVAIGIYTDERYRRNGFCKVTAAEVIRDCFVMGFKKIDWLCVDSNKGSIAIAEKLGFKLVDVYYAFTSYPPIENLKDLSEDEWHQWGKYLEDASKAEDCLLLECVYSYIKSNDIEKTISIMKNIKNKNIELNYLRFKNWIINLQSHGMCSNFTQETWTSFIDKNILSK